jgi:hypothetical protein
MAESANWRDMEGTTVKHQTTVESNDPIAQLEQQIAETEGELAELRVKLATFQPRYEGLLQSGDASAAIAFRRENDDLGDLVFAAHARVLALQAEREDLLSVQALAEASDPELLRDISAAEAEREIIDNRLSALKRRARNAHLTGNDHRRHAAELRRERDSMIGQRTRDQAAPIVRSGPHTPTPAVR